MPPLNLIRILDANFNRLREGLRVVEEFHRFFKPNRGLAWRLKQLRHKVLNLETILEIDQALYLESRDVHGDFGAYATAAAEKKRLNLGHIVTASHKRAQESARVLEEMAKLIVPKKIKEFKAFRFALYELEKKSSEIIKKLGRTN